MINNIVIIKPRRRRVTSYSRSTTFLDALSTPVFVLQFFFIKLIAFITKDKIIFENFNRFNSRV